MVPASADRRSLQLLSARPSQPEREANKRHRNGPGRLDAGTEIAGDLRYTADPALLSDGDFQCRQSRSRDPHQHFQIPAIGLFLHAETRELIPPDGAKWRQVREARAIEETQKQPADMGGKQLLWSQAAGLAQTT